MADNIINVRIKDRSDTEANWTSKNPVLLKGERAITDGTGKYKIGDGKNTWSALPYYEAMTSADRTKLNGIASGANKTTIDSSLSSSSTNPVQNKVVNSALAGKSNTNHTHDLSTMINTLSIGSSTPTDDDYFVSQYSGGGTTTTTYHRRPVKALLEYIKGKLAKVATSGSYNDLSNKPTIPSVGNGTITIKQAGTVKGSFTTNQSGATTIELTDNNTNTWIAFKGATTSVAGTAGYAPAPSAGAANRYLRSDGTWSVPPNDNTTYSLGSFGITASAAEINYTKGVTSSIQTQLNGKAASSHSHSSVNDASNGVKTTFAYSKSGLGYNDYSWLAGWNGTELRAVSKSQFATAGHTHNYAGSSSAGGAATSAVKLSTARTVSTSNSDFVLSFNYDGSANSTASLNYYNCKALVQNTNNYPYHRFAKLDKITSSYADRASTILITQDYEAGGWGIVKIVLRTNGSGVASNAEAKWLVRSGLNADSVQIGLYNVNGNTYADVFFKISTSYAGTVFRNLASSSGRGSISRGWTFLNSSEVANTTTTDKKTSTECYTSIPTAATDLHSQAYSKVISASDAGTVSYANSAGSANSVAWTNVSSKPAIVGKTVRTLTGVGTSGWKDVLTDQGYIPDMAFIAYWNGAYSGTTSNLAYCNKGAFGTAATKSTGDFAAASHSHSQYYDGATTRTANTVLAAPNGSNGKASFRKLVAADIPSLTKSKISDFSHTHDDRYYTETEINTKLKNKILPQSTEPTSQSEGDYWLKTTTL